TRPQLPSRFIRELPDTCVTHDDTSSQFFAQVQQKLITWLRTSDTLSQQQSVENISIKRTAPQKPASPDLQLGDPFGDTITLPHMTPPEQKVQSVAPAPSIPSWRLQQRVVHPTFGEGIIKKIEHLP